MFKISYANNLVENKETNNLLWHLAILQNVIFLLMSVTHHLLDLCELVGRTRAGLRGGCSAPLKYVSYAMTYEIRSQSKTTKMTNITTNISIRKLN